MSRRPALVGTASFVAGGVAACRTRNDGDSLGGSAAPGSTTTDVVTTDVVTTDVVTTDVVTTDVEVGDAYFPPLAGIWEPITPSQAGFTDEGVKAVLDLVGASNSQSFVLLRDGRIVAERYWMGADDTTTRDIASAQKPVTSTLLGLARDRGLLQFDDSVSDYLGAGWSRASVADEGVITLRHLMTMTSGLNPRTLRKDVAPDVKWDYNTDAYQKLRQVLEVAVESDINTISDEWLFEQIGVGDGAAWNVRAGVVDAVGDEQWGLTLTAREIARFGLFAARNGQWMGTQIADPEWFAEAWTATPLMVDYGLIWWLIGKGRLANRGAPPDLVAGLGAQDQKLYVSPSTGIVVARQGNAAGESTQAGSDFDALLIEAIARALA